MLTGGKTALFVVGRHLRPGQSLVPSEVADEFIGGISWKLWDPTSLSTLIREHLCVVDVDTLSPQDKRALISDISDEDVFYLYSRSAHTMVMLGGVNELLILSPQAHG